MQYQHDKVLFSTSELFPLIKTGGLADVSAGLPLALKKKGVDLKVILPAYLDVKHQFKRLQTLVEFEHPVKGRILKARVPGTKLELWLVDIPVFFDRSGGPYTASNGKDWPDNAERFSAFCKVISAVALGQIDTGWRPTVVHCNDWQTGLVPVLLTESNHRPKTIFTIHNLAYQGLFDQETFEDLQLPEKFWSPEALEFHDNLSFIKGGLAFADKINTVSPTYANEIQTPRFGYGLEGLLKHRSKDLSGIVNGVDYDYWNPGTDPLIAQCYTEENLELKAPNKSELQQRFKLPQNPNVPLIGTVGRMVDQKGYDLILAALPQLMAHDIQVVMLGSGDKYLEAALQQAAKEYPDKLSVIIGYDENLAHLLEAGSDIFLMPSRFEPCGLNQIYSQRYGTIPVVHYIGGLADTVVDANVLTKKDNTATGFHFQQETPEALYQACVRALDLYQDSESWSKLVRTGMTKDFSWGMAAEQYLALYKNAQ